MAHPERVRNFRKFKPLALYIRSSVQLFLTSFWALIDLVHLGYFSDHSPQPSRARQHTTLESRTLKQTKAQSPSFRHPYVLLNPNWTVFKKYTNLQINLVFTRDSTDSLVYDILSCLLELLASGCAR
ncbi:hypothetical protein T265_07381 [Opisthorchis viverrini]|uniref:Uncharacterized protein n=1 Tax=Opisthorchis viverrini TaxID=6198 RepID=A0A074ZP34_OPIVI|nr:hypothetical protein T265_07381 [Opisthorchis viverrini]KER25090.1 hypothetical protein T265_07381 [Opisthorchis viverrini]